MKNGIKALSEKMDALEGVGGMVSELSPGNVVVQVAGELVSRPLCQEIADTSTADGLTKGLFYYTPDGTMYYLNNSGEFV